MSALDVLWLPAELEVAPPAGRAVVVIDVIRATTSIATAIDAGAASVTPAPTIVAARDLLGCSQGALLCGEREGLPPTGFDLGNSPRSFQPGIVAGRRLVFTTTNGTAAIHAVREAETIYVAAFRNAEAVVGCLGPHLAPGARGVLILCAGRRGRVSMDDAWCAGHLVERAGARFRGLSLGDGAHAARALAAGLGQPTAEGLGRTAAGRALRGIGLGHDLTECAAVDDLDVVPTWREGAFVKGGEEDV